MLIDSSYCFQTQTFPHWEVQTIEPSLISLGCGESHYDSPVSGTEERMFCAQRCPNSKFLRVSIKALVGRWGSGPQAPCALPRKAPSWQVTPLAASTWRRTALAPHHVWLFVNQAEAEETSLLQGKHWFWRGLEWGSSLDKHGRASLNWHNKLVQSRWQPSRLPTTPQRRGRPGPLHENIDKNCVLLL